MSIESIREKVAKFWADAPEKTVHWKDELTQAQGWLIINNKVNGVAAGGIRMASNVRRETVVELAKTMSLKFTLMEPQIGGAKSGICYDPKKPDKQEVLERFVEFIKPSLMTEYGTGGDLNVGETELLKAFKVADVPHLQYGIAKGLVESGYPIDMASALKKPSEGLMIPYEGDNLWNFATGRGVVAAAKEAVKFKLKGKRYADLSVAIQGFGAVGGSSAKYFHENGMKVVAIADELGMVYNYKGLDVPVLLKGRIGGKIIDRNKIGSEAKTGGRDEIIGKDADILVPAADSHLIHKENAKLIKAKIIIEGANNPIDPDADKVLFGEGKYIIPDFIANSGAAVLFHQCIFQNPPIRSENIIGKIDEVIGSHTAKFLSEYEGLKGTNMRLFAQAHAISLLKQ